MAGVSRRVSEWYVKVRLVVEWQVGYAKVLLGKSGFGKLRSVRASRVTDHKTDERKVKQWFTNGLFFNIQ